MLYLKLKLIKCKMLWKIKIWKRKKNKEYGIKRKKTLYGKKMPKIKCQKIKKVKKHINNGRKNLSCLSLKLGKHRIKEKPIKLNKAGFKEESLDMDLKKLNKQDQEGQALH